MRDETSNFDDRSQGNDPYSDTLVTFKGSTQESIERHPKHNPYREPTDDDGEIPAVSFPATNPLRNKDEDSLRNAGVFVINKKNPEAIANPVLKDLHTRSVPGRKVDGVNHGKAAQEARALEAELLSYALTLKKIGITFKEGDDGSVIVDLPPELQTTDKIEATEVLRLKKEVELLPFKKSLATLTYRAERIAAENDISDDKKDAIKTQLTVIEALLDGGDLSAIEKAFNVSTKVLEHLIIGAENQARAAELTTLKAQALCYVRFSFISEGAKELGKNDAVEQDTRTNISRLYGILLEQLVTNSPVDGDSKDLEAKINELDTLITKAKQELRAKETSVAATPEPKAPPVSVDGIKKPEPQVVKVSDSEKLESRRLFDDANVKLKSAIALRDSLFENFSPHDDEKSMVLRLSNDILERRGIIEAALTSGERVNQEDLRVYSDDIDSSDPRSLTRVLVGMQKKLSQINGIAVLPPSSPKRVIDLPRFTGKPRMVLRRGGGKITVEEWQAEQEAKKAPEKPQYNSMADVSKALEEKMILKKHQEMFNRGDTEDEKKQSREQYKQLYLYKEWLPGSNWSEGGTLPDDPTRLVVYKIFDDYKKSLEAEIGKNNAAIANKEVERIGTTDPDKISHLNLEIEALTHTNEPIQKELDDLVHELKNAPQEAKRRHALLQQNLTKTLAATKETYSPSADPSVYDIGRDKKTLTPAGKKKFGIARMLRKFKGEDRMTDEELVAKREEPSLLTDKVVPNHHEGMVRMLDVKEVTPSKAPEVVPVAPPVVATPLPSPVPPPAIRIDPALEAPLSHVQQPIEKPTSPQPLDPSVIESENTRRKHEAVNKVLKALDGLFTKKHGRTWRAFALPVAIAASALAAGGIATQSYINNRDSAQAQGPRTLGQAGSWRDFVNNNTSKLFVNQEFLNDAVGDKSLSEVELLKKYAPLLNVDPKNPSTIKTISDADCSLLTSSPDPISGLQPDARGQLCDFVIKLNTIAQYTTLVNSNVKNFVPDPFVFEPGMTVGKLIEKVKQLAARADLVEAASRNTKA